MSVLEAAIALTRRGTADAPGFVLDASIEAPPGITVIFGDSGAGKSTLLQAVLGAVRPDRGRVALGGRALFDAASDVDLPIRARRIGIVFQDALLFPHVDAAANVAFGLQREDALVGPAGWLERVGAASLAARRPATLSGGERQRIALARALAARPDALLLDEPFAALDAGAREKLGGLLLELQRQARLPFVHVTHDPAEALRLGDAMVVLAEGKVVARGTPAELLAPGGAASGSLDATNWLRGSVVEDGPESGRVDLGGTIVVTPPLGRPRGAPVVLALPAEEPILAVGEVRGTSARNVLPGVVAWTSESAEAVDVVVATPILLRVRVTRAAVRDLSLENGSRVWVLAKASSFRVAG